MILNQTDTGKPCPKDVYELKKKIPVNDSLMQYVEVNAWSLAKVLDRLEYLEKFESMAKEKARSIFEVSYK